MTPPLNPIGDIATPALTEGGGITWETATDWDNAVDEARVVHDTFGDRDEGEVVLGFKLSSQASANLLAYYPFDDESTPINGYGPGAVDLGTNGTLSLGATGLLGSTEIDFTDAFVGQNPGGFDIGGQNSLTVLVWVNPDAVPSGTPGHGGAGGIDTDLVMLRTNNNDVCSLNLGNGDECHFYVDGGDGGVSITSSGAGIGTGTWYLVAGTWDGSTMRLWLDAAQQASTSYSNGITNADPRESYFGAWDNSGPADSLNGQMGEIRIYDGNLTPSELQEIYDTVYSGGYLTTATKSFVLDQTPDLSALDYALNGEGITLDVIGSPGTASEEIVSQTLDGATSYNLTWSASHADFRIKINHSTITPTATPVMRSMSLQA